MHFGIKPFSISIFANKSNKLIILTIGSFWYILVGTNEGILGLCTMRNSNYPNTKIDFGPDFSKILGQIVWLIFVHFGLILKLSTLQLKAYVCRIKHWLISVVWLGSFPEWNLAKKLTNIPFLNWLISSFTFLVMLLMRQISAYLKQLDTQQKSLKKLLPPLNTLKCVQWGRSFS